MTSPTTPVETIDLPSLQDEALALLQPPIAYVPIRHHSPTCARYVRSIVEDLRPAAVLVEGPPSFDRYIDLLLDPAAKMPLAIYSHATFAPADQPHTHGTGVDGPNDERQGPGAHEPMEEAEAPAPRRFASYFPLCDYSPELAALRAGRAVGAELHFVDLDVDRLARHEPSLAGHADERRYRFSEALRAAAAKLGCRDHNELWDHMVEAHGGDQAEQVAAVLTYGALARADADPAMLAVDGTHERELAMARGVDLMAQQLSSDGRSGPIVVVTGAFHTVALARLVAESVGGPMTDSIDAMSSDSGVDGQLLDSGHGLIRYSFDRLDALAGYAAGMPSPRWYQLVWDHGPTGDGDHPGPTEPHAQLITGVAAALRSTGGDGQPSVPAVVDAFVAAERLRVLRQRSTVARTDVLDAMVSCFTKGEDSATNPVRVEAARNMTGFDLGTLPPGTPRVPLAIDFDRLLAEHTLEVDTTEPRQLNLDVYRSARDQRRSRLLHGLTAIDVLFGRCITPLRFSRASGRDVIRERWVLQLTASTDASLTEASIWGASVAEAVEAKTSDELMSLLDTQPTSAQVMQLVMKAAQRGVPRAVTAGLDEVRQRVAVDSSLPDVVAALSEAELLWSAREPLGGSSLASLPLLAEQLFVRACQLGGRLHTVGQDQRAQVEAIEALHRIVVTGAWPDIDNELFWNMLADQRHRVGPGMLRAAIAGLEWRGGRMADDDLVSLTMGHVGSGTDDLAAEYLTGLLLVAREALWEIDGLVTALSEAIGGYDQRQFLRRVAGLRSAFASLTPRQTDRLAEEVADGAGAPSGGALNQRVVGVSEQDVVRNAYVSAGAVEQLEADGLGHWLTLEGGLP